MCPAFDRFPSINHKSLLFRSKDQYECSLRPLNYFLYELSSYMSIQHSKVFVVSCSASLTLILFRHFLVTAHVPTKNRDFQLQMLLLWTHKFGSQTSQNLRQHYVMNDKLALQNVQVISFHSFYLFIFQKENRTHLNCLKCQGPANVVIPLLQNCVIVEQVGRYKSVFWWTTWVPVSNRLLKKTTGNSTY